MSARSESPPFAAPYAPSDEAAAKPLFAARPSREISAQATRTARELIRAMRADQGWIGGVEDFLHEFALSSREGLAIMTLAESLLRVPDDATLDALIADRLRAGDFEHHHSDSESMLVQAFAFALGVSAQLIGEEETPRGVVADLARRIGAPALRAASRQAMRLMGAHFVFGETIEEALARAADAADERHSFDMLGEGARTAKDAARYFDAYAHAIDAIGARASGAFPARPGVSIKLSALHPRYEAISRERVLAELTPRVLDLARRAQARDLVFTIDAEEADRLELSLGIIDRVVADASLADWEGFGLAVQAYQKRAGAVIDHVAALAAAHRRRLTVRLVKGAYWDTEIKRAQERGLADYPVFTRKAMTDVSFVACAQKLFAADNLFPQFATHNALSVATILALAGKRNDFEFQRLHGMGAALYDALRERSDIACRVYAPVGAHRDLLAYLVRRLIENGANSSFVARAADPQTPEDALIADPFETIGDAQHARHARLKRPAEIFQPLRANSRGVEFGDRRTLDGLLNEIAPWRDRRVEASPSERVATTAPRNVVSPIDRAVLGSVIEATGQSVGATMRVTRAAFAEWNATPVERRAVIIERAADAIEAQRGSLIALLQSEAGKTLDDALAEVREAADLARYYAAQMRAIGSETALPGPTGEDNRLRHIGRGVFICISPWNFPLAIFLGQIAAALVAGNTVVAKPAEQTPLIAHEAVAILHEAGVPPGALQLAPGDGAIGAALVAHEDVAGVLFTGSAEVARKINRMLAAKDGPIAPLIAETGGVNAMIVDSTALLEQVTDDVLTSAFRSAGQRCSALRLLCLQEDIADAALEMIVGATRELRIGDPREVGVHIGPVIDAEAKMKLEEYVAQRQQEGRVIYAGEAPSQGQFVAPHIIRLDRAGDLRDEIFGPVLHIATWRAEAFDTLVAEIVASRYGLTIGLHSRIDSRIRAFAAKAPAGNVYVNRNMIGAAVGSQPFGGFGLSGTGPKAGGPDYLRRFLREETVTINTAAMGGDAQLMSMED